MDFIKIFIILDHDCFNNFNYESWDNNFTVKEFSGTNELLVLTAIFLVE